MRRVDDIGWIICLCLRGGRVLTFILCLVVLIAWNPCRVLMADLKSVSRAGTKTSGFFFYVDNRLRYIE